LPFIREKTPFFGTRSPKNGAFDIRNNKINTLALFNPFYGSFIQKSCSRRPCPIARRLFQAAFEARFKKY
jgi:hypothetical protein